MALLRFPVVLLLFVAASAAAGATALEKRVEPLLGYWFSPATDAAAARVLRITNVIFADAKSAVLAAQYGPASAVAWDEARELTAQMQAGRVALELITPEGTRKRLVTAADGALQVEADPRLRFARSSLAEIHRFTALHPMPTARAGKSSVIELVYIGADDCSLCRRWEAGYLGQGKLAGSPDWPHVRFTEVKLPTLSAPFRREHLPERLRPRFDALMAEGLRIHGVPSFVLLVDDQYRAQALGPAAFESFVYIALRAAVQEKLKTP
jgi:hypothetical protein